MSSISNNRSPQEGFSSREIIKSAVATAVSGISISLALITAMHQLRWKSYEQTGIGKPANLRESLKVWSHAAPFLGGTLCAQMVGQRVIERGLNPDPKNQSASGRFWSSVGSSFAIGALTSPLLAIFNGLTMGKRDWPTRNQMRLTTFREGIFVLGLTGSSSVGEWAKLKFGGRRQDLDRVIDYGASGFAAAAASILSHPFDTQLSALQAGVPLRRLMSGVWQRAFGVVSLTLSYRAINGFLQPWSSRILD